MMHNNRSQRILERIKGKRSWRPWEKILGAGFLITLLVIDSGILLQCLSLIVGIYYQVAASMLKDVSLMFTIAGTMFFTMVAFASARLISKLLSNWMFGKM